MSRRLKRAAKFGIMILFLVLTLGYASFPWWVFIVINQNLPESWSVRQLEIGYPSWQGIMIYDAEIESGSFHLKISRLSTDLELNHIQAEKLAFSLPENATTKEGESSGDLLQLPSVNLQELKEQFLNLKIDVNSLSLQAGQEYFQIIGLQGRVNSAGKARFEFKLSPNKYLSQTNQLNIFLKITQETAEVDLMTNQAQLLTIEYRQNAKSRELGLELSLHSLHQLIPQLSMIPDQFRDLSVDGDLSALLTQQSGIENLESKLSYSGNIRLKQLNDQPLNLSLTAKSGSNHFPLKIKTQIHGELDSYDSQNNAPQHSMPSENNSPNVKLTIKRPEFDFESLITIDQTSLIFAQNKLAVAVDDIELTDYSLAFQQADLIALIDDFEINEFPVSDILFEQLNSKVKISQGRINYGKLKTGEKYSAIVDGELEINGLYADRISGKLKISDFQVPDLTPSKSAQVLFQLNQIDTLLSRGTMNVTLQDENGQLKDFIYQQLAGQLNINFAEESITGNGEMLVNNSILTPLIFTFNKSGRSLDVDLPEQEIKQTLINQLTAHKSIKDKLDLSLESGQLSHIGQFAHQQSLTLESLFELNNGYIQFEENRASNVSLTTRINSIAPLRSKTFVKAEKIDLASGLEVSGISAEILTPTSDDIEILNLKMQILSSEVLSEKIAFKDGEILPSTIIANNLSLTELLFFTGLDKIFASGDIDLTIPLDNDEGAIAVTNARFNSLGNGIIKYDSSDIPEESKNIALTALENFHYTQLDGNFDYNDKSGQYHIGLHLLGANPDLYDGYPVDFVINLDGNLPGIFKSMFLSGNFEQAILDTVKTDTGVD